MTIGIGVIGCGQWGMNHVRNFSALPEARVLRCCDAQPRRLQAVQRLFPAVPTTTELSVVLNDPAIHAVVIATPSATHYEIAKSALEQGKDVLCEKPLTTAVAECEALVRLAEQRQRVLMVGHVFVFNSAVQKLHEYVTQGLLGRLYYLSARRTNLGPFRTDVDAVWDLASHDLSIFDYLLGGDLPLRVSASGGAFLDAQRVDVGFISLEYPNRVMANIHVSWLDPQKRREITVVGSEKMAIFNDVSFEAPLWLYDKGAEISYEPYESFEKFRVSSWERDATVPNFPRIEPLANESAHFLQCVNQRQRPQTDGRNGLRIVQILEAVSRSIRSGGAPTAVQAGAPVEV